MNWNPIQVHKGGLGSRPNRKVEIMIKIAVLIFILMFAVILPFSGCKENAMPNNQDYIISILNRVPKHDWQQLSKTTIYFGHQSVGYNIIDGIRDIMKRYPGIKFNITETSDAKHLSAPTFAHSLVGKNKDPYSKIDDFRTKIEKGIGDKARLCFFKFCFVDIKEQSDEELKQLFRFYEDTLSKLKREYQNVIFVHVTCPLIATPTDIKTKIKKLIHYPLWSDSENMRRCKYNELVIKTYGGKEPIFDLARTESTFQDGSRCSFTYEGHTYYNMVSAYTNDDGHLNTTGRKLAAAELLVLLAKLASADQR